jgi:hypothetical protein
MHDERTEKNVRRPRKRMVSLIVLLMLDAASFATAPGCGGAGPSPTAPTCDQACQDAVALRAFRETVKQVFNGALQDMPVGAQDRMYDCTPLGGKAHITGTATSNANVGTTTVSLTYVLDHCRYLAVDVEPTQNYDVTLTGTAIETGVIAVQPGTTTSLTFTSAGMTFGGTVYSPPLPYPADAAPDAVMHDAGPDAAPESACALQLTQNGNQLSGTICGRSAGVSL